MGYSCSARLFTPALLLIFLCAGPVQGQTIRGVLLGGDVGEPLPGGVVSLLTESGEIVAGVAADSTGAFTIRAPEPGRYFLRGEFIGYRTVTDGVFDLGAGGSLEVEIRLRTQPIEIEGIEVSVDPVTRRLEHRVRSMQHFSRAADEEALRSFSDQRADLLWFLPSMTIAVNAGGEDWMMMAGRFKARYFVDDLEVVRGEFLSYQVGEICRVEVVRRSRTVTPADMAAGVIPEGGVHLYTCRFMEDVRMGRRRLSPVMPVWGLCQDFGMRRGGPGAPCREGGP